MSHILTLLDAVELTPDTRHYLFTKPEGYAFDPGQATELALEKDGWRDEKRPFTFTSDPAADILGFTIKSYPDHDGVTEQLWHLTPGAQVSIGDAWGAIEDKGPGVFIAGGAGITPFLGILKARARSGSLDGSTLIYANSTPRDIILRPFWESAKGLTPVFVVETGAEDSHREGRIDEALLTDMIVDWDQRFYLCGPPPFEEAVMEILNRRGVPDDRIVREED